MDCIVDGVTKSCTRLSDFHFHFQRSLTLILYWVDCLFILLGPSSEISCSFFLKMFHCCLILPDSLFFFLSIR